MGARFTFAVPARVALGLLLSACSLAGPTPHTFTTASETKAVKPSPTALEQASEACKTELRQKGIKSVLAILSSMRPGAVDENYVKCMQAKGFAVEK
jgi:hypothetical protein